MKKYDKYKDSGIEWIGEIPEHWEVKRVASLGKFSKGGGVSKSELTVDGLPVILYGDIYTKYDTSVKNVHNKIPVEIAEKARQIEKNAILFTGSGETIEDIGKCVVYLNDEKAYAGGDVIILEQQKNNSLFLSYVLNTPGVKYEKAKYGKGEIVVHIYSSQLREIKIPIPPPPEQTAIATYLDRKTAEIDQLIDTKKRLIELYHEEKTAIINQAVTKGINPNVKMKDSGVEWLGEVPEHWEVKRVKQLVSKVGSGVTPSGGASVYQTSGIPLLRSQNIHFDGLKLDDVAYISEDIHNDMSNSKVKARDVLINITGASIGRTFYVEEWLGEANVNQHVCIIRPKKQISSVYLYYLLRSNIGQEQIRQEQTGSGREGLTFEAIKRFVIPFVEIEEQQSIVHHIEAECRRIDTKIERTQRLIELLAEYRTALISEVVTGKVKVV
jgi:type I restriction enzyme S subunit